MMPEFPSSSRGDDEGDFAHIRLDGTPGTQPGTLNAFIQTIVEVDGCFTLVDGEQVDALDLNSLQRRPPAAPVSPPASAQPAANIALESGVEGRLNGGAAPQPPRLERPKDPIRLERGRNVLQIHRSGVSWKNMPSHILKNYPDWFPRYKEQPPTLDERRRLQEQLRKMARDAGKQAE